MVRVASSRAFGLIIGMLLALLGGANYRAHGHWYTLWAGCAVIIFATALVMPRLLAPLRRSWLRLGELMNVIVSPLFLTIVYVVVISPIAIFMRLCGKDLLSPKRELAASSYWIRRRNGVLAADSLTDPF